MKNLPQSRCRHLQFEALERREVMAAGITAALNAAGTLNVVGTAGADQISFLQKAGSISIAGVSGSWAAASVRLIVVDLKAGNDFVSFASVANGGNQAIQEDVLVQAGGGSEKVRVPSGGDVSFSSSGSLLSISASGVVKLDGRTIVVVSPNPSPTPQPTPGPSPNPNPTPPTPTPGAGNWFSANVLDTALRTLGDSLYADGQISRNDMIALLRSAKDNAKIDATELADLRKIVSTTTLFGSLDYVRTLSSYVVNSCAANRNYMGQALGNLVSGSTDVQMEKLIGKWFLGLDRPTATGTYRQFTGTLFVNGAQYTDIRQGAVGDCYFLATLAEVALRSPADLANMFVVNGDGTYGVRFFNNNSSPVYVTVDSYLPTNSSGQLIYASRGASYSNTGSELWVALAEKAYAQLNEFGWSRSGLEGSGQNSYAAISGGYIFAAMNHLTGRSTTAFAMTTAAPSFAAFVTAFNQGKLIGFASYQTPAAGSGVVGSHAYAVVSYNAANQTITLYNPWGPEYGQITLTWSQIQANFQYFDRTV